MSPTIAALVVAVTSLCANGAILVKVIADKIKLTNDRMATKAERDTDSQKLHDDVQRLTWENARIKEDITFTKTSLDDHQVQLATLNTELAKVSTKLDSALDILHDLKEAQK
jgi:septal ring factor EnvC (AmiA/AmiB activator)